MDLFKTKNVFNERGELCSTIIKYLERWVDKEFIPKHTNQGYRFDWQIIPGFENYFGIDCIDSNANKPLDISVDEWVLAKKQVQAWINWVSINIFYPTKIIFSSRITDHVLLRIAVSRIDKIALPKHYLDSLFDNLIYCYHCRKRAYNEYYYREVLGLPF